MKKLFTLFALLAMFAFAGCENPEEPILKEVSSLMFNYSFPSINQGESMTKAGSNADIFAEFYAAICDGRLVAPSYDLTFTNILTGEEFQLQGMWNVRTDAKIKMGTYSVRGTATAEGAYIQDKCSIVIDDPEVVVDRDEATVTLSAVYDCALVIFDDQSIVSVVNHTGDSDTSLFDFEEYIYAFVNDKIWDGVSDSYLLGTRQNGSEFKIPTQLQPFLKGKFYVYDTTKTDSFESTFILPAMGEGGLAELNPEAIMRPDVLTPVNYTPNYVYGGKNGVTISVTQKTFDNFKFAVIPGDNVNSYRFIVTPLCKLYELLYDHMIKNGLDMSQQLSTATVNELICGHIFSSRDTGVNVFSVNNTADFSCHEFDWKNTSLAQTKIIPDCEYIIAVVGCLDAEGKEAGELSLCYVRTPYYPLIGNPEVDFAISTSQTVAQITFIPNEDCKYFYSWVSAESDLVPYINIYGEKLFIDFLRSQPYEPTSRENESDHIVYLNFGNDFSYDGNIMVTAIALDENQTPSDVFQYEIFTLK